MVEDIGASSSSSSSGILHPSTPQNQERHRRRRRRTERLSHATATPSAGLLSILATIASASCTADASPVVSQAAPPPFLCPFIEDQDNESHVDEPSTSGSLPRGSCQSALLAKPTPTIPPVKRSTLPDKYEPGTDGSWRRAEVYTLYGSTVCLSCTTTPTSTPGQDDSSSNAPASTTDDILSSLPKGWQPQGKPTVDHSPIILCVSLVVALIIVSFMVGIIFWRRRRLTGRDVENKARKKLSGGDGEDASIKEARSRQKMWTKATARWKSNIRHAARRRRPKRSVPGAMSSQTALSSIEEREPLEATPMTRDSSLPPSRGSSRRQSVTSIQRPNELSADSTESTHSVQPSSDSAHPVSSPNAAATSPPAYPHPAAGGSSTIDDITNTFHNLSPSHETSDPFAPSSLHTEDNPPYSHPPLDEYSRYAASSAHVALDDKGILARMANLASAPPTDPSMEGSSSDVQVSAPVWRDEELEHFDEVSRDAEACTSTCRHYHSRPHSPSPLFPAPPPKAKMAGPAFYDYTYSFEDDIANLGPEAETSAPPFEDEGCPSAPPRDEFDTVPSAPPLADDLETGPSAPEWDNENYYWDGVNGAQNHDRMEGVPHIHRRSLDTTEEGSIVNDISSSC